MIVSADLHPDTKSRPLYRPVTPDPAARAHLIVTNGEDIPADIATRFAGLPVETWTGQDGLTDRLAAETTGLRLIVIGTESFLWTIARIAEAAGLGADEISLHPTDQTARRVQCLHCKTIIEDVTTPTIDCPTCHLRLLVRDHFSRRLAAFQGIATHGVTRGEK